MMKVSECELSTNTEWSPFSITHSPRQMKHLLSSSPIMLRKNESGLLCNSEWCHLLRPILFYGNLNWHGNPSKFWFHVKISISLGVAAIWKKVSEKLSFSAEQSWSIFSIFNFLKKCLTSSGCSIKLKGY